MMLSKHSVASVSTETNNPEKYDIEYDDYRHEK